MLSTRTCWASSRQSTVEGGIDSSQVRLPHGKLKRSFVQIPQGTGRVYTRKTTHLRFEVLGTMYGCVIGARRHAESDSYYRRSASSSQSLLLDGPIVRRPMET
jgi:hypothetical protein